MNVRILLVDDNLTFANSVRNSLGFVAGAKVLGHAANGAQALAMTTELQPDLMLLDIAMPDMTGLEVAQTLQTWAHAPAIIFLTTHDGAAYREAARKAGAMAFITKDQMVAELLPLIENWNSRVTQTETVQ